MGKLTVPEGPKDLTPKWVTSALRTSSPTRPAVKALDWEAVGPGLGFTGQVVRLHLTYEPPANNLPSQMIAKFAAPRGSARDLLNEFGGYDREVRFYLELADHVGLPAPCCYYADRDGASGTFVLLLEDMAPAKVGDQVSGASADEAEQVVTHLARFHAQRWNDASLLEQPWLGPVEAVAEQLPRMYEQGMQSLRAEMPGRFPHLFGLMEKMEPLIPRIAATLGDRFPPRPFTLVHGDVRLDNILFPSEQGGRFAVIDWQGVAVGSPAGELAYWLILSLPIEVRRRHQDALLARYLSGLVEHGVKDYSLRRLRRDYATGILTQIAILPVLAANLDFSSERGQALSTAALERMSAAAIDLKAARTARFLTWLLRFQALWAAARRTIVRRHDAGAGQHGGISWH